MCILSCASVPWAVSFSGTVSSDLLFRLHFLESLHRELCISVSGCTYFQISLKIIHLLKSTKLPSPMYTVFHLEMWKLYPNYTLMLLAACPYYYQCSRCFKHLQFWMQKSVFLLCSHGHCNQKWAIKYFIYIYTCIYISIYISIYKKECYANDFITFKTLHVHIHKTISTTYVIK